MSKGLFGGMTEYNHQSFSDIINDLKSEQRNVTAFIEKIEKNLNYLNENGFWKSKVNSNFRIKVAYSLKLYKTSQQELFDIEAEIQIEVKEHHCKRLSKLAEVADEINIKIGKI